jgi:hypothetical protein
MTGELENDASLTWSAGVDASIRGDFDLAASMCASDVVRHDRRQLGAPPVAGLAESVATDQASLAVLRAKEWHGEVLEVAGARLALTLTQLVVMTGDVVPGLRGWGDPPVR